MEEAIQPSIKVFYSYAHEDILLRDELEKHLGILKRRGYITDWNDRDISAGKEWKQEIDANLGTSDIILLLVSPDFIHSDYSYGIEMEQALEKHKVGEARAIPIILRPVDWDDAPFSILQALPTNAKPITTWPIRDEAFLDVAKGIRKVVNELLVEKYLARAKDLFYEEEQDKKAFAACEHAVRLNPKAHEAFHLKSKMLTYLERYEEALAACQSAIDIAPNNVNYMHEKGNILLSLNRHEDALTSYQQAIDLDPLETDRYMTKGNVLFSLGRYKEALTTYQQASDLEYPDSRWLYAKDIGDTLFKLNRYEEAIAAYNEAIAEIPDGGDVANCFKRKGDALFELGRYKESLEAHYKAQEILTDFYENTEDSDFLHEMSTYKKGEGDALFKLARYEEALIAYQLAIDLAPDTSAYFNSEGEALYQLKRYDEALVSYDHVIRLAPGSFTAYRKKAVIYGLLAKQADNRAIEIENDITPSNVLTLPLLVEKLTLVHILTGHTSYIRSVAISPDGQTLVSGSHDNTIKIWNIATGKEVRTLTGHTGNVWSVAISADGQTLVSGSSDNTIKVWEPKQL